MPEQKISRVLFPSIPPSAGLGTMIIYLGPLLPKDSSDLPGSYPLPSAQDESLVLRLGTRRATSFFLTWSCSQVGFARTRVTTGTGGLLHHLFTLSQMAGLFSVALSVPSGLTLTGPRVTWHLALESSDFPPPPPKVGEAIIYSALATLTHLCITSLLN